MVMTSAVPGLQHGEKPPFEKQVYVTANLLNKCPLPVQEDFKELIALLKQTTAVRKLLAQALSDNPTEPAEPFREGFRINCEDVDQMMEDLWATRELNSRIVELIAKVRLQFGGLDNYFRKADSIRVGDINKGIDLLEEMCRGDRFGVQIFPNDKFIRNLMQKTTTAEQAEQFHDYLTKYEFFKPNEKFFKLWLEVCKQACHFEALCRAVKLHGCDQFYAQLSNPWLLKCQTFDNFRNFSQGLLTQKSISNPYKFFMSWLEKVDSLEKLLVLIENLFKTGVAPDDRLVVNILSVVKSISDSDDKQRFMAGVKDLYMNADYSQASCSAGMRSLYTRLKGIFS